MRTIEDVFTIERAEICPKCGAITYASFKHYIAGDW